MGVRKTLRDRWIYSMGTEAPNFITIEDAVKRLNRDATLIRKWCRQGRIPGAVKLGRDWLIPADVMRPPHGRPGRRFKTENLEKKLRPIVERMFTQE